MSVQGEDIVELKKILQEFRLKLVKKYGNKEKSDSVYRLSLHFYPLIDTLEELSEEEAMLENLDCGQSKQ